MPHRPFALLLALAFSLVVISGAVLAAGSPERPPTPPSQPEAPPTPGVEAYNQGVRLMKKEKFPEAQAKFEEALAANAELAEAHNNLGYSLRKQGTDHYAEALEHYNQAIAMKPKLAEAYMYRGVLHMLMGHEDLALADHKTLTGLNRKLADELEKAIASKEEPTGLGGLAKAW
jgi:tetratricopeptide (TPR) repeat protein